ncbi:MAG: MlaD family protein [Candidatus Omnitrophica bacterium]|jgi:phospholipid/cholesterol/gamma-HCH transport system substrate-binding protein|nr:MlaD family protein [Candidatus Omnitrophota bacterium]MDD5081006.1 MlaD family protein [Candidatus Omnitrophota bacterium]MDD5440945.1 MlaD family protein [Candidatus Omnitrophota bacterium]
MKKVNNEVKVGLFFILAVFTLVYMTYRTGKLDLKRKGYPLYVVFEEVAGIEKKSPVMLNGFEVGKVNDIDVRYENDETKMILELWIDRNVKVTSNPIITIKTLGLMGEKYVQIASAKGDKFLQPGETLQGKRILDMDVMLGQAESIAKNVNQLIIKMAELSDEIKVLAGNINETVDDSQGAIARILDNVESATVSLDELSLDLKQHPWKLFYKN